MSLKGKASANEVLKGRINRCNEIIISAYQIAVKNGFGGTEAEWLESLKGAKGDPGVVDENGVVLKDRATGKRYEIYVSGGKLTMAESE